MQQTASRHLSRDYALDYLFQESVEEQFETLRLIQQQPARKTGLLSRIAQWLSGHRNPNRSNHDYWKEN